MLSSVGLRGTGAAPAPADDVEGAGGEEAGKEGDDLKAELMLDDRSATAAALALEAASAKCLAEPASDALLDEKVQAGDKRRRKPGLTRCAATAAAVEVTHLRIATQSVDAGSSCTESESVGRGEKRQCSSTHTNSGLPAPASDGQVELSSAKCALCSHTGSFGATIRTTVCQTYERKVALLEGRAAVAAAAAMYIYRAKPGV